MPKVSDVLIDVIDGIDGIGGWGAGDFALLKSH
jgi:hypothetical protein